jgi:hypothetical protein
MNKKLCPIIILEGARLTLKTVIAFVLKEHRRIIGPRKYRYHSPLISAECCSFTNYPWGRGLINYGSDEEALAMETSQTWARMFELQRYYSWIIERFHISTRAYQSKTKARDYGFEWLEQRLQRLGIYLVFVTRSPESFKTARAEGLEVSGNPSQYDDLKIFIEEQEMMNELVAESVLPTLYLDVSDNDVQHAAECIADWLEGNSGLWME